jgi:hypothetical protein
LTFATPGVFDLLTILPFLGLILINTYLAVHLSANEDGLWWRQRLGWQHLPWAAITTIARCDIETSTGPGESRFVIASAEGLLTWRVPNLLPTTPFPPERGIIPSTQQVIALTLAQTGLPLRDLTPLAQALAQQANDATNPSTVPARVGDDALGTRAAALFTAQPMPPKPRQPWFVTPGLITLAGALCFAPFFVTRTVQDTTFPSYLASLPAKLQAHTPMLTDPLTHDSGRWPIQHPGTNQYDTTGYTNEGYIITNGGGPGTALLPNEYHAVAIQVTVRFSSTVPESLESGAGIMYDEQDEYEDCTFLIDTNGDWQDACDFHIFFSIRHSSFIHQGANASNTLLVIIRGQYAIFYINGHWVGDAFHSYFDSYPFGHIGLVNEADRIAATFTNFALWSVNAPPNPNYV